MISTEAKAWIYHYDVHIGWPYHQCHNWHRMVYLVGIDNRHTFDCRKWEDPEIVRKFRQVTNGTNLFSNSSATKTIQYLRQIIKFLKVIQRLTSSWKWTVEHWRRQPINLCGFHVIDFDLSTPAILCLVFLERRTPPPQAACIRYLDVFKNFISLIIINNKSDKIATELKIIFQFRWTFTNIFSYRELYNLYLVENY